jgi:hypothetical protein
LDQNGQGSLAMLSHLLLLKVLEVKRPETSNCKQINK